MLAIINTVVIAIMILPVVIFSFLLCFYKSSVFEFVPSVSFDGFTVYNCDLPFFYIEIIVGLDTYHE